VPSYSGSEGRVTPRKPNAEKWFSDVEQAQLRRLVYEAFDVRETPYLCDAVEGIIDWQERTSPDRFERHARKTES
jgi:hypothetical protein